MSSHLLACRDLVLARPGAITLHFPDFTAEAGSKTLLIGPSGCGKTTLLSMIAGLLKPSAGHVLLNGQDIYDLPAARRDHIRGTDFGFVFQTLHLLPSLTLRQNILLAADMARKEPDYARLDALLDKLGLADKAHRKPEALSQGEQQRAAIARTVFNSPRIILADEPTSALDDRNAKMVIDLIIRQAQETNAALVIATHDHRIIDQFDTVIHLRASQSLKEAA